MKVLVSLISIILESIYKLNPNFLNIELIIINSLTLLVSILEEPIF